MGRLPFLARPARGGLVFDGAMTTVLRASGWPSERPVELANVEAPELVRGIHEAYRRAGGGGLNANTLGAHGLRPEGLELGQRGGRPRPPRGGSRPSRSATRATASRSPPTDASSRRAGRPGSTSSSWRRS